MTEFEALIEDIRNHGVREVLNDEEVIDIIKELEVTSKALDKSCEEIQNDYCYNYCNNRLHCEGKKTNYKCYCDNLECTINDYIGEAENELRRSKRKGTEEDGTL